jgi:hypothetical protein
MFIKTDKTPEQAFLFFIENCSSIKILEGSVRSGSGVLFVCTLNSNVTSPYEMLRHSSLKPARSPVKKIIVKLVVIGSEGEWNVMDKVGEEWKEPTFINQIKKKIETKSDFLNEAAIQTSVFLKTVTHLNPLCPAPVYSSIKTESSAGLVIDKMKIHCNREDSGLNMLLNLERVLHLFTQKSPTSSKVFSETAALSSTSSKNLSNPNTKSIIKTRGPANLGIFAMEFADGYIPLSDCYNKLPKPDVLRFENMARLKLLDLASITGYSHNDFHAGNMMVNPSASGYYAGILGNMLIIDFGFARKLPKPVITKIKTYVHQQKYINALRAFRKLKRPDGALLNEENTPYAWFYFLYNKFTKKRVKLSDSDALAKNDDLFELKRAEIIEMVKRPTYFYDRSRDQLFEKPDITPSRKVSRGRSRSDSRITKKKRK